MYAHQIIAITPPKLGGACEALSIAHLLRLGVGRVHIRKPDATEVELEALLSALPTELRRCCVLSHHIELVARWGLGGVHLSVLDWSSLKARPTSVLKPDQFVGVSCHNIEELERLPFRPDYAYVSPVAPSISKPGYGSDSQWTAEIRRGLSVRYPFPLIALGGVGVENAQIFLDEGFSGVAFLGYFAGRSLHELTERVASLCTTKILLCGGIDPTAEAGLTADMQHATRLGVQAYSIATALTSQDAVSFTRLTEVSDDMLVESVRALRRQSPPAIAKVGLLASLRQLYLLVREIRQLFPACRIVWDPILRTSSGADLLPDASREALLEAAQSVDVLLPNSYECCQLFGDELPQDWAQSTSTTVICKSAASTEDSVTDRAYLPDGRVIESSIPRLGKDRHGTGCLYATTLCVSLARGVDYAEALHSAQRATMHYRLGYAPDQTKRCHTLGRRMFVTHATTTAETLLQTDLVLRHGLADVIELRMKDVPWETFLATAHETLALCRGYGVSLMINDRVDVALIVGADGVHLGQGDMSPVEARRLLGSHALIGLTCNTSADLASACTLPIDYVGIGPFRFTTTKQKLAPILGLEGYRALQLQSYPLPAYAIGSVRPDDIPDLYALGLYGVAMSSSLIHAARTAQDDRP
ncbi:thiamine phosphate synthase [Porphyromonas sp.]